MNYFVYILYSPKLHSFYKGQTSDIEDRIHRHNNGYEKSTASGRPWKLIWVTEKPSRSEALKLERKLKNLNTVRLIKFMLKYEKDLVAEEFHFINGFEP